MWFVVPSENKDNEENCYKLWIVFGAQIIYFRGFDVNFLVKVSNYLRPKEGWAIAAHAPKFPSMGDLVQHYQSNDLSTSPLLAAFTCSFDDEKNSAAASITSQTRQSVRLREPVNRDVSW